MLEQPRKIGAKQGIADKNADDQGQDPTERPACDIKYQNDQYASKQDIPAVGVPHAEGHFFDAHPLNSAPGQAEI